MPLLTPHYNLTAFQLGDTYSASADRRRFSIIDNQLSFLAELIGDGIIDGWIVTKKDGETITISPGIGIIDGFVTATYGKFDVAIPDNRRLYLFMRRKPDILAETGAFSDIETIVYLDTTTPATPATPIINEMGYQHVALQWTANSEPDLSYYKIYRYEITSGHSSSSSLGPYPYVSYAEATTNAFIDIEVNDGSLYTYEVSAVDFNGHESPKSLACVAAVPYDVRIPTDPTELDVLSGNQTIQIYWGASNFLADTYKITIQPIDLDGQPEGGASSVVVSKTAFYHIFAGLENGQLYQVTVSAQSKNSILSTGVSGRTTPMFSGGSAEIESIAVNDFAIDSSYRLGLHLSWELQNDEYLLLPDYYLVTVYRDGETGVPSVYTSTSNTIIRYTIRFGNKDITRDIEEETKYTIKIQTVSGDATSNGFIIRYKTKKFRPPQPISELAATSIYDVNTRSVVATWENSVSDYAYNILTVKKVPLDVDEEYTDSFTEILEDGANYGKSDSYSVKLNDIDNMCRYEFYLTTYDAYGNHSQTISASTVISQTFKTLTIDDITVINVGERPPVPTEQYTISGNDQVTIYWNAAQSDFIDGYKVWRAEYKISGYNPIDFSIQATLPANIRKFNDYAVDNGKRYAYIITTLDVFGNESLNPSDGYFFYVLAYAAPRGHSNLLKSPAITVGINSNDAILSWVNGDDAFDGYEIYRSEGNNYSFAKVGTADASDTGFIDKNALVKSGNYHYMIRKFTNDAEVYTSRNRLATAGSLSLGSVSRFGSTITIDRSDAFSIKLMEDPIKKEIAAQFSKPTHLFFGTGDDRRVRMQNNLVVTQWATSDYQVYSTDYSMLATGNYIAYVNGVQSAFGTVVDRDKGTITFEQAIFDPSINNGKAIADQVTEPSVMVIFLDVGEITGTLPTENIESLSGAKVTKGKLPIDSLPQLDHFGRYRERCVPSSADMVAINPQVYSGTTADGVTFYDVIKVNTSQIMAATSAGIMRTSVGGGSSLDTVLQTSRAATRVIYCPFLKMYFVAVGTHVVVSTDGVNWNTPSGMEGVTFIRDIISDENGTVYATADSGVYKIQPLQFVKLFWTQLSLFDPNDTNAYGIAYDNGVVVSGSNGLYGMYNGANWVRLDDGELQVPIHSIVITNNTWFLVSNNKVWRKGPSDTANSFVVVGDFASPCRKGAYFASDFYVTTDQGLYRSANDSDVIYDTYVKWQVAFPSTARNGIIPATHALKVLDSRLWMGQDERLYSATIKRSVYTNADVVSTCPTVFVDGVERSVGVYYSQANNVTFDTRLAADSRVAIVRQYTNFTAPNGGWADLKYDAEVLININGSDIIGPLVTKLINGRWWRFPPTPWTPPNDTKTIATAVSGITTPFFNGRTANFDKAMASLTKIVQMSDAIVNLDYEGEVKTVPSQDVANLFKELDRFKTFIHPGLRPLIKYPAITGVINYNGFTALYDVVNGTIEITNGVDKYTKVAITVKGVSITNEGKLSHEELEDIFDTWNSGLSANMALVQQTALIRAGIYQQSLNTDGLKNGGFEKQAVYKTVCDGWYDKFLSTIDYDEKLEQLPPIQGEGVFESTGFSIDYAADALHVPTKNEVWICGGGGIIAINKTTFETSKIVGSPFYFFNMVLSGGIVYTLCEDGVYTIDLSNGQIVKDVDLAPPDGFTSVFVNGNTTYIATNIGVFSKRPFEIDWSKVFDLTNASLRSSTKLTFAVGKNPNDITDSLVYYSFGGVIWNRSNTFSDIIVNSVAQRYNSVYYATNSGLLHEDLSNLFSNSDFDGPTITAANLEDDDDVNATLRINDVDADDDRAIAVTDTGKWYSMSGGSVIDSGQSRLETIHKIKVIDGKYWLFSDNLIEVENVNRLIPLSTGRAIL